MRNSTRVAVALMALAFCRLQRARTTTRQAPSLNPVAPSVLAEALPAAAVTDLLGTACDERRRRNLRAGCRLRALLALLPDDGAVGVAECEPGRATGYRSCAT